MNCENCFEFETEEFVIKGKNDPNSLMIFDNKRTDHVNKPKGSGLLQKEETGKEQEILSFFKWITMNFRENIPIEVKTFLNQYT